MNNSNVFKVGDTVTDIYFGVGTVETTGSVVGVIESEIPLECVEVIFENLPLFVNNSLLKVLYTIQGNLIQNNKVCPIKTLFSSSNSDFMEFLNYPVPAMAYMAAINTKFTVIDKMKICKHREQFEAIILKNNSGLQKPDSIKP